MSVQRVRSGRIIPILDIAKYHSNRSAFVEELRVACHTVGFFLVRHDFGDLARSMLDETKRFFDRPLEQKLSVSYEKSPSFRGFMQLGVENTSGRVDCREQVEYAVEYRYDTERGKENEPSTDASTDASTYASDGPARPFYERLKGRNPWPTDFQPTLEPITHRYTSEVCAVADILRDSLCLALKLDPGEILHDKFRAPTEHSNEVPHWVVKLVSYPPPPPPPQLPMTTSVTSTDTGTDSGSGSSSGHREEQQGVGAHTDTNFLTLVLQDDSCGDCVGGLQAYSRGEWIDVTLPSSCQDANIDSEENENDSSSSNNNSNSSSNFLICNLGEQAETWSRGYFLATPHRVIMKSPPPTSPISSSSSSSSPSSSQRNPRTSVPLFYNPVLSATMGPLDERLLEKVSWERPREYQQEHHWRRPNNLMNPSVGENTFKSLARSHPQVFARHHPDLELLPDGRIVLRDSDSLAGAQTAP